MKMITKLTRTQLEQAFLAADEDLSQDISVIRLSMIRDVHYGSVDFTVSLYGQGNDPDSDPPVEEFTVDPDAVGGEEVLLNGGIQAGKVATIFDKEQLALIRNKPVAIEWLKEDGNAIGLDIFGADSERILHAVDQ